MSFTTDISLLRERARSHMEDGPLTPSYGGDKDAIVQVLNDVVATEIVCFLRYQQHSIVAAGIHSDPVAREFREHAGEELQHAQWAAERINQIGGTPDFNPGTLVERSQTLYRVYDDTDLVGMMRDNLEGERVVIQSYQEMIRWIGDSDPTTRRLLERILEQEEEHADDLRDLLGSAAADPTESPAK